MHFSALLAETNSLTLQAIVGVAAFLFVFLIFVAIWVSRYKKVGPDEVLVVSGRRNVIKDGDGKTHVVGFRLVRGGGTFVWPIYEKTDVLSMKPVTLDLVLPGLSTRDGHRAEISALGQVRIKPDDNALLKAAESLLGKQSNEIKNIASQLMESSVRGLIGAWTSPEMFSRRGQLSELWGEAAKPLLSGLGLEVSNLAVRDLKASQGWRIA